ncbi:amidohydrolase (plasmid) [Frondihabitans sp. PAMC 28766]|uniref:amidohydrolase family protein n=1 Tax=Frondihabitans sp. PAMC 28766 TaxID=1795630 RepID=UPI00078D8242|nr:amidohydrolase family protein [Frondihabitans sp. PAMC 28766]AMM22673.1 amidohydrolase [Frondihabitans sp. PAMC 28766]
MRIVALEEHFVFPEVVKAWEALPPGRMAIIGGNGDDPISRRLLDIGEERIAAMDDQGVDVQVLSLNSPGVQSLDPADAVAVARDANDFLAEAIAGHPDRFQGFAAIPTPDPGAAAAELERAVTQLGFAGALLNGRTGSTNADAMQFDDLYATAERLGVPLYFHPQTPVAPVVEAYYSGFGDPTDFVLRNAGIGWHYETGMQILRMVFAGVFDRHPDLQVVAGHWGEVVLFYLERTQQISDATGVHLERTLEEYARNNVWVTGSGLLSQRYLRWSTEVLGADRIMSAVDYPFIDNSGGAARRFLEEAPLSVDQRDGIGSGNWERLLTRRQA